MEIKIISGEELDKEQKIEVSRLFVNGFYQWFKFFSKDMEKIAQAFQNSFILKNFYFAVYNNNICGMAACTNGKETTIRFSRKDLTKHLGLYKGVIASIVLKREIEKHSYPFELDVNCGSAEFITTDKNFRGTGIASKLLHHIIEHTDYDFYVLEVADTNYPAVKLYEKTGFEKFFTVPCKYPKQTGFNNYVYMKYKKPA